MENEVLNKLKLDWKKIIEEQEKSGLSQAEYCRQNEIEPSKLTYYRSRIKSKPSPIHSKSGFHPVKLSSTTINEEIKIVLPNGFQCVFSLGSDVLQIKKIIELLVSC